MARNLPRLLLVLGNDHQTPDPFTIQARALAPALAHKHRNASLAEMADREGVNLRVAGDEAEVSGVEESVVAAGEQGVGDQAPLFGGGVDTRRVVRAGMEEDDGGGRKRGDVGEQSGESEGARRGVVPGIGLDRNAEVTKDTVVSVCRAASD